VSNVVKFPLTKRNHAPQNEAELQKSISKVRESFVTSTAVDLAFDLFGKLETAGIDLQQDEKIKYDLIMISESIKSAMFRSLQMKHPLQEFSENVINMDESDISFEDQ